MFTFKIYVPSLIQTLQRSSDKSMKISEKIGEIELNPNFRLEGGILHVLRKGYVFGKHFYHWNSKTLF